jgi:argininosuccinate synthase
MDRLVLAYSGGPSSSIAIPWLREQQRMEVVTVSVDLGQPESLEGIRVRALASGAVRAHVLDWRAAFARECVLPAVQGGMDMADPENFSVIGRPLIARALVEIAHIEGATVVAHAETDPQAATALADAVHAIDPALRVINATERWTFDRASMAGYARERGIPFAVSANEDDTAPAARPLAADRSVSIEIEFRAGVPCKINGIEMDLVELMTSLDTIAGPEGVPGSAVLSAGYAALRRSVPTGDATGVERVRIANGACEVMTSVNE